MLKQKYYEVPDDKGGEPEVIKVNVGDTEYELPKAYVSAKDAEVSRAYEKGKAEAEKKVEERIAQAKAEAEERAKMTEQERLQAEFEEQKQKLEQEKRELAAKQKIVMIKDKLAEKSLPQSFASWLMTSDDIDGAIDTLAKEMKKAVDEQVQEKFRKDPPKSGDSTSGGLSDYAKQRLEEQKNKQTQKLPWE